MTESDFPRTRGTAKHEDVGLVQFRTMAAQAIREMRKCGAPKHLIQLLLDTFKEYENDGGPR